MCNYLCNIIKKLFTRFYVSPCWSKFKATIVTDCMHWTYLDPYLCSLAMNNKAVLCNCHIFDDKWGVSAWGVSAQEGGGVCPGGVRLEGGVMWPIQSCIWCYLYAASTPTECQHQCSCLYSVTQVRAGIPPSPVNRITDRCKNITLPQLRWGR